MRIMNLRAYCIYESKHVDSYCGPKKAKNSSLAQLFMENIAPNKVSDSMQISVKAFSDQHG